MSFRCRKHSIFAMGKFDVSYLKTSVGFHNNLLQLTYFFLSVS